MKRLNTWCLFFPLALLLCIINPANAITDGDSEDVPPCFKCYQAVGKTVSDANNAIESPFSKEKYVVKQPIYLCVPCLKESPDGRLTELNNLPERLVLKMYLMSVAEDTENDAIDQFDVETFKEREDNFLFAVPAIIEPKFELLYAVDGAGRDSDPHLYTINPSSGAVLSDFGPIGFEGIDGIAIEPKTGKLYGISNGFFRFPRSSDLIHIDPALDETSLIGGNNPYHCSDLAFDTTGTLYGWREDGSDNLVTFDLTTGVGTIVGEAGIRTVATGLAFDSSGTLWLKWGRSLYTIDQNTGVAKFHRYLDRYFDSILAIDENDIFYTGLQNGDIYTFDSATGVSTFVSTTGLENLSALEFGPEPDPSVFLDHFMCHPDVAEKPDATVMLKDRFGKTVHTVGNQTHLCLPSITQSGEISMEGPLIKHYEPDVPYTLEANWIDSGNTSFQPLDVQILDQFGKETLRLITPSFLIVPSTKTNN